MNTKIIFLLSIILLICLILINNYYIKLDQAFYDYKQVFPELILINKFKNQINIEIKNLIENQWIEWPEKYLYNINNESNLDDSWKIIPIYGFGIWCNQYVDILPSIYNFLKGLKGLKLAIISRLKPFTKLEPHQGWGFHSNNVLRCHYGLKLPNNSSNSWIEVMDSPNSTNYLKVSHKLNDWIIFDDSKTHFAVNNTDEERIILIVDIQRPTFIKMGTSKNNCTKELYEIVTKFKNLNMDINTEISREYIELCNNIKL